MIRKLIEYLVLRRNLGLSSGELERLQTHQLRAVLRTAYEDVPYYRERFDAARVEPDDVRSSDDLRDLPITTKEDLRAAGQEAIVGRSVDRSMLRTVRTSGSTGEPFEVLLTSTELQTRRLLEMRTLLGIGFRPRDRLMKLGSALQAQPGPHEKLGFWRVAHVSGMASVDEQVASLRQYDPTVLWSHPSLLEALLHHLDQDLAAVCRPRLLITSAEVFDPQILQRGPVAALDIETFNFYGAVELGRVAWECRSHTGLHVNADHFLLEVLPLADGRVDGSQVLGETVVTAIYPRAIPLIRYRLGDLTRHLDGACPCGCSMPRIAPPLGRVRDLVRLPSGRVLSPYGCSSILRSFGWMERFRVVQQARDRMLVEFVARDAPTNGPRDIASRLRDFLGEPIHVEPRRVEAITPEGWKRRDFVSCLAGSARPTPSASPPADSG